MLAQSGAIYAQTPARHVRIGQSPRRRDLRSRRLHFYESVVAVTRLRIECTDRVGEHDYLQACSAGVEDRRAHTVLSCQTADEHPGTAQVAELRGQIRALKS